MRKIVFTGLDNSGKTSIIKALQSSSGIIPSLKPTTGVEREEFRFLDYAVVHHDLGGQKKYLIKYLAQPDKYFAETDVCIYVIDIQDIGRFQETLKYFDDLLNTFIALRIKPAIYVFFHKSEYIIQHGDVDGERNVGILQGRINESNAERFKVEFCITTVYDVFSISSSFSTILQNLYPPKELINKTMGQLANDLNAQAIVLFDEHIIPLAKFLRDESYYSLIQFFGPYFFTFDQASKLSPIKTKKMKLQIEGYEFIFLELKETKPSLYLLILGNYGLLPALDQVDRLFEYLPQLMIAFSLSPDELQET
ncbi:MAG: ADP-ribosylation factor-like protein [Candidatus Hodarchaeota archaeon]